MPFPLSRVMALIDPLVGGSLRHDRQTKKLGHLTATAHLRATATGDGYDAVVVTVTTATGAEVDQAAFTFADYATVHLRTGSGAPTGPSRSDFTITAENVDRLADPGVLHPGDLREAIANYLDHLS